MEHFWFWLNFTLSYFAITGFHLGQDDGTGWLTDANQSEYRTLWGCNLDLMRCPPCCCFASTPWTVDDSPFRTLDFHSGRLMLKQRLPWFHTTCISVLCWQEQNNVPVCAISNFYCCWHCSPRPCSLTAAWLHSTGTATLRSWSNKLLSQCCDKIRMNTSIILMSRLPF